MKSRFKIVSDGTPLGTQVIDLETGEPVEHVKEIVWTLSVEDRIAEAHITLFPVAIEAVGAARKPAESQPESREG